MKGIICSSVFPLVRPLGANCNCQTSSPLKWPMMPVIS